MAVEGACCSGPARHRARGLSARSQIVEPRANVVGGGVRGRLTNECGQVGEVAPVGIDRARRAPRREQRQEPGHGGIGHRGLTPGHVLFVRVIGKSILH
jgi:hypothetical protein